MPLFYRNFAHTPVRGSTGTFTNIISGKTHGPVGHTAKTLTNRRPVPLYCAESQTLPISRGGTINSIYPTQYEQQKHSNSLTTKKKLLNIDRLAACIQSKTVQMYPKHRDLLRSPTCPRHTTVTETRQDIK